MMYRLNTVILMLLFTISFIEIHSRDEIIYGIVTTNNAIVRVGPDFAYGIIEQLPIDASVEILGRAGSYSGGWDGRQWLQIVYDGKVGWVIGRIIRMGRPFNAIPLVALNLPRNRDGRVPEEFDLSVNICDRWQGEFSQSGNFMAGDQQMSFVFPEMPGTVNYSFVAEAPSGLRRTFDTSNTSFTVLLGSLNLEAGIYSWYVIPYWNDTTNPRRAQQLCVRRLGGTFEKPDTTLATPGA